MTRSNTVQMDLEMSSGETPQFNFPTTDKSGQPVDITGATIIFRVCLTNAFGRAILTKRVGSGITIDPDQGANTGLWWLIPLQADTDKLYGSYYYEAKISLSGVVLVVVRGALQITKSAITV